MLSSGCHQHIFKPGNITCIRIHLATATLATQYKQETTTTVYIRSIYTSLKELQLALLGPQSYRDKNQSGSNDLEHVSMDNQYITNSLTLESSYMYVYPQVQAVHFLLQIL